MPEAEEDQLANMKSLQEKNDGIAETSQRAEDHGAP